MRDKYFTKNVLKTAAVVAIFILLLVLGWMLLPPRIRGHLHVLTPRLTGKVTVVDENGSNTYRFSARGGYGSFEWTVGEDATPVNIRMWNFNDWHVSKMNFRVEKTGDEWKITGTIDTDGYELREYSSVIPDGEPIVISFDIP